MTGWGDCIDCGMNTMDADEYYMVHNEIWAEVVPDRLGMLCIGCLERRLGRQLEPSDFTDAPLNGEGLHGRGMFDQSPRLRNRLGRP
jgi:hypothetical protein